MNPFRERIFGVGIIAISAFSFSLAGCSAVNTESVETKDAGAQIQGSESTIKKVIELPDCSDNSTLILSKGGEDITMKVVSAYAVNRIKFNEQTDVGDVAKPGYTICLADFELDPKNPWARPEEGQLKVEVRVLTGDNSPIIPGVYKSPTQGNLQVAPLLYIGVKTHPILFPKIGRVLISKVDDEICGVFEVNTIPGLKLEGPFRVKIIDG
jgi:hypothetical protein